MNKSVGQAGIRHFEVSPGLSGGNKEKSLLENKKFPMYRTERQKANGELRLGRNQARMKCCVSNQRRAK